MLCLPVELAIAPAIQEGLRNVATTEYVIANLDWMSMERILTFQEIITSWVLCGDLDCK